MVWLDVNKPFISENMDFGFFAAIAVAVKDAVAPVIVGFGCEEAKMWRNIKYPVLGHGGFICR